MTTPEPTPDVSNLHPLTQWALFQKLSISVQTLGFDEFTIVTDDDGDTHLKCPHCGSTDGIIEIDMAMRHNDAEAYFKDGSLDSIDVSQSQSDFETLAYACAACTKPADFSADFDTANITWS